jgi:hypothetical protein
MDTRVTCKVCRCKRQTQWKREHNKVRLTGYARHRAKIHGWPCNLTLHDFEIPEYCPVLGLKLSAGSGKQQDSSPTLDRIIPDLGYVPGNIRVISYKANRMRSNATLQELKALVAWLEKVQPEPGRYQTAAA